MKLENWNPNRFDQHFENIAMDRLVDAAEIVAQKARRNCSVGTISRPMYSRGKYAGQPWTSRDAGRLKKSIRIVRQRTKSGKAFSRKRNIRIYAGHYLAYYVNIVEHNRPFLRPAFFSSMSQMRSIIGAR